MALSSAVRVRVSPEPSSPLFSPPLLPARSPLRPPARSISSTAPSISSLDSPVSPQTPTDDLPSISLLSLPHMPDTLNTLPDALLQQKSLPDRPQTPQSISLDDDSTTTSPSISNSTSSASSVSHQPTMSKRHHAMHELLSSERAYASDLVLITDVHIPLALGLPVPLQNVTQFNPSSSSPSSRTLSTSSFDSNLVPSMSTEDVKIIFSNIEELAILSNTFTEQIEHALGHVVDGGQGEDCIGALFLETIPTLERPYKQYITRHPTALQHLQNLPQTPALAAYLAYTQRVASEYSHAWDLASLLIKPVQRLLKYPLLLNAIIDETPDAHPDKENLRSARERIEELARNVNEGRRRAEVVKDVLTSKTPKKPNAPVGVSASVNLSKVKSLRHGGVTAATMRVSQLTEGNGEAAQVEAMQAELKKIEVFAQQFARNVVDWGKMMANVMLALRTWALSFGKVIGLSPDQRSEAFDAFMDVIKGKLMPLTADLEAAINERLLKDMAHLLMTMNQPLKLLASMNEQEPYHYHLLTMPVSQKNRPPPALLAASTNYLALRGQLAAELPTYLALLHKGFVTFVLRLSAIQTRFWQDVKDHWAELWEMLRVESELNVGWEETCHVWQARWADVDEVVGALNMMWPVPHVQPTPRVWYSVPVAAAAAAAAAGVNPSMTNLAMPPTPISPVIPVPAPVNVPVPTPAVPQSTPKSTQTPKSTSTTTTPSQFDEYFAYPGFYMPMTPFYSSHPKEKKEKKEKDKKEKEKDRKEKEKEKEKESSGGKIEKHNSKSSSGHGHNSTSPSTATTATTTTTATTATGYTNLSGSSGSGNGNANANANPNVNANTNANTNGNTNGNTNTTTAGQAKAATVHSIFAALEPAHSPVVRKHPSKQGMGSPRNAYYPNPNANANASNASVYAVSGPMPLGSVAVPVNGAGAGGRGMSRGRGASRSDVSTLASGSGSGSGSGGSKSGSRRPSSQDSSAHPHPHPHGHGNANGNGLARRRTHGHGMAEEYAEYVALHAGVPPAYEGGQYPYSGYSLVGSVPYQNHHHHHQHNNSQGNRQGHGHGQGGLTRMKSMPLNHNHNNHNNNNNSSGLSDRASMCTTGTANTVASSAVLPLTNGGGYVVDGDRVYYRAPAGGGGGSEESWDEQQYVMEYYQYDERGRDRTRAGSGSGSGRGSGQSQSQAQAAAAPKRDSKTKEHARKRSGSVKSITSFFSGNSSTNNNNNNNISPPPDPQPLTASQRDSWVSKPAKYVCQVIHPCKPPASVSYYSFPFFTLREGDLFEVLQEAGHPSIHPKLPLYVDDGEDCLLLCRDGNGVVGWALASFLEPLSISG